MRNSSVKTPKNKKTKEENAQADKSSGKKMVQARLPFKIIATSPGSVRDEKAAKGATRELRKRKLSISDSDQEEKTKIQSVKENVDMTTKKKKMENVNQKEVQKEQETIVLDDEDDETEELKPSGSSQTPKSKAESSAKKGPQASKNKRKSDAGSAKKVQIKISVSNKKKRRKSKRDSIIADAEKNVENDKEQVIIESSDDGEAIASDLNPEKKQKLERKESKSEKSETVEEKSHVLESSDDNMKENENVPQPIVDEGEQNNVKDNKTNNMDGKPKKIETKMSSLDSSITAEVTDATDREADDELDGNVKSDSSDVVEVNENANNITQGDSTETKDIKIKSVKGEMKKPLTPKQLKLMEQRKQAREEKERKLQEERLKKQREKEEKEQERKREREEKEQQKRKEREEKNQKRLAELEAKNDEKRKRIEAKEEELRKKEEERKRKEQEKEEAKMKEKKAAEAFTKFFVAKGLAGATAPSHDDNSKGSENAEEVLAFRPFQVKGDMTMAPLVRKDFSQEAKEYLDMCMLHSNDKKKKPDAVQLYLDELKSGKVVPNRFKRRSIDKEDDDVIFTDDLERAGEAIVEEAPVPVERFRAKFYKFHENQRPPYFGTWRKKTHVITPRRPFAQDKQFFDYEVDSDLEWEEEEPGESLDGSDDDKEKESEEDEYEVDNEWFVPHGHLSEEELQNEDEFGLDETTREAQKAKLKLLQQEFAQEMKKKTEKIKPRLIGCIWVDENGNQPEQCPKIIWDLLAQRSMLFTEPPLVDEPETPEKEETNSPNQMVEKLKPMELSEGHVKDLVRLLHGNRNSKGFLIKEFQAHMMATEETVKNGEVRGPLKASLQKKIDELAEWSIMEVDGKNYRKKTKKRLCWVVTDDVLKKMDMEDLSLQNKWNYTLEPKYKNKTVDDEQDLPTVTGADEVAENTHKEQQSALASPSTSTGKKTKRVSEIKKFAKILTPEEKSVQQQKLAKPSNSNGTTETKTAAAAPIVKKRVPILMSVPRGEKIPTAAKNALISQYLLGNSGREGENEKKAEGGDSDAGGVGAKSAKEDVIVLD